MPAIFLDQLGKLRATLCVLAHDDVSVAMGIQNVPALMLAEAPVLMLGGVGIVRMNLNGEVIKRVKHLDQERESVAFRTFKKIVVLIPQLGKRHAIKRAAINCAVTMRMGGDAPALPHGAIGQLITEFLEPSTSPNVVVQNWLEHNESTLSIHGVLLLVAFLVTQLTRQSRASSQHDAATRPTPSGVGGSCPAGQLPQSRSGS